MKPPICVICKKRFNDMERGGLINFKKTQKDLDWQKEMKESGKVGHPPYAEWFCEEHYPIANKFSHLPKRDAMNKIKGVIQ